MSSDAHQRRQPHVVLIPQPAPGHVTPMLHLAKALHARGFRVTFVNSEYNRRRLLRSRGPGSLDGADGFRFEAVPDGLPPSAAARAPGNEIEQYGDTDDQISGK